MGIGDTILYQTERTKRRSRAKDVLNVSDSDLPGCCRNPFSFGLKRFLIHLRLAPGYVKTRLLGLKQLTSLIFHFTKSLLAKVLLMTAQGDFGMGNSLIRNNVCG
jgi:hypothetical protein